MTEQATLGTTVRTAWALPLFLARTAWADQPYDVLTEHVTGLTDAHLLELAGDPVAVLDGVDPVAGPVGLLPGLVAALRRSGGAHPVPEVLSLLTAAPGDVSSLPPVPAVRADVGEVGWGVLIRDPASREAVCLTVRQAGDILRWRARGVADCPVVPQPHPPAAALAELGQAVVEAADLIERSAATGGGATGVVDVHGHVTRLPAGLPSRVLELVDRIDRVEAIVAVALAMPGVGTDPAGREPVLRRLVAALDAARRAAVTATGEHAIRGS